MPNCQHLFIFYCQKPQKKQFTKMSLRQKKKFFGAPRNRMMRVKSVWLCTRRGAASTMSLCEGTGETSSLDIGRSGMRPQRKCVGGENLEETRDFLHKIDGIRWDFRGGLANLDHDMMLIFLNSYLSVTSASLTLPVPCPWPTLDAKSQRNEWTRIFVSPALWPENREQFTWKLCQIAPACSLLRGAVAVHRWTYSSSYRGCMSQLIIIWAKTLSPILAGW